MGQIKNCDVHHSTSVSCIELVANMTTCATFLKNMSVVYGVKTNIRLTISHIFVVHVYFFSNIFGSTPPLFVQIGTQRMSEVSTLKLGVELLT